MYRPTCTGFAAPQVGHVPQVAHTDFFARLAIAFPLLAPQGLLAPRPGLAPHPPERQEEGVSHPASFSSAATCRMVTGFCSAAIR